MHVLQDPVFCLRKTAIKISKAFQQAKIIKNIGTLRVTRVIFPSILMGKKYFLSIYNII